MIRLERVTPPAVEPVTVLEAKDQLRIASGVSDDDTLLARKISAARRYVESYTNRTIITTTWRQHFAVWADVGPLLRPALQTVSEVGYRDADGAATVLDAGEYWVDGLSVPGRVCFKPDADLPTLEDGHFAPVSVTFVAGYGDNPSDVPQTIREAVLVVVADMYEFRSDQFVGGQPKSTGAVRSLLAAHRVAPGHVC